MNSPPRWITSGQWPAAPPIAAQFSASSPEKIQRIRRRFLARSPDYLGGASPKGFAGLRIGYDALWAETAVDEPTVAVVKAARETLASLGATIVEIAAPDSKAVLADWIPNCAVETAVAHEKTYPSRKAEYGPALAGLIDTASALSALDYQKILLRRAAYKGAVAHMFGSIDLLLVPAQSFAAPMLWPTWRCSVRAAT